MMSLEYPSVPMAWFKQIKQVDHQTPRSAERVAWSAESELSVAVILRTGDTLPVEWLDLSVSGAKILVPSELEQELHEGNPVRLSFEANGVRFRINARIMWVHVNQVEEKLHMGVRFAYVDPELGHDHPELWQYFNRRKTFRASPPAGETVSVSVECEQGALTADLLDISATGISLMLPKETGELPWVAEALGTKLALELKLSEEHELMHVVARVERMEAKARGVFWGLSFLEEDERDLGDELETIADFVMARQRQLRGQEEA